jgi:DNA-binding MarR family transcriptional regulator
MSRKTPSNKAAGVDLAARPRRAGKSPVIGSRGILPSLVGYHLRLAQIAVFRDFENALQDIDTSPGRFGLLVLIRANPGLSQSRLAEALGLDRSSLVPALNKLELDKLVERRASSADRRANGIWLTAQGNALVTRMQQRVKAHEARLLRGFSAAEKAQLVELLGRVRRNLHNGST